MSTAEVKEKVDFHETEDLIDKEVLALDEPPSHTVLPLADQTRSRNRTEKGQQYQLELVSKQITAAYSKVK